MHIIIGENSKRYMKLLQLKNYPFTPKELKTSFRKLIKTAHSDLNKKSDDSKTREFIEAYNHLKNLAIDNEISEKEKEGIFQEFEKQNQDIFKLWKTCPKCKGTGKQEIITYGTKSLGCIVCNYTGFQTRYVKCRDCKGTGTFILRSGREVTCRKCKGLGLFPIKRDCPYCKEMKKEIRDCSICKGLGKVEMKPFNPVIPKASVMI